MFLAPKTPREEDKCGLILLLQLPIIALHLPELKLSKKAVEMSQCVLYAVRVQVEVSQGLVSCDVTHLLQAARKVLSKGPHRYTLYLPVHDNGAGGQTLYRNTQVINHLALYRNLTEKMMFKMAHLTIKICKNKK